MGKNMIRLFLAVAIIIFGVIKFCSSAEENPYTGETQYVGLSAEEEIALGLQSAPMLLKQYGGQSSNMAAREKVNQIGQDLVANSIASSSPYKYDFYLLADRKTINAFALPGGPIFITEALYSQLQNDDQLAGVLGHEIGHVIGRHSAERMAKLGFTNSVLTAVAVGSESQGATQLVAVAGNLINMKYGRGDELDSDNLGVKIMLDAGYDPEALIAVMEILKQAGESNRTPEFQSTHPDPDNRAEKIREAIEQYRK